MLRGYSTRGRYAALVAALTTGICIVIPSHASAAQITYREGQQGLPTERLDYVADPGEQNRLTVTKGEGQGAINLFDTGAPLITPGPAPNDALTHCVLVPFDALCLASPISGDGAIHILFIELGDGADRAELRGPIYRLVTLHGGDGNDALISGVAAHPITLRGGRGDDSLSGNAREDTLVGGPGADYMSGGDGVDVATYADSPAAVVVTLDGIADDGAPGEGDNVLGDVEHLIGSAEDDTLIASAPGVRNTLDGGPGDDHLEGGAEIDTFPTSPGADHIDGGPDHDIVDYRSAGFPGVTITLDGVANDGRSGEGDNLIAIESVRGTDFNDNMTGSDGADRLDGRGGDDILQGLDGGDTLIGDPGNDRLLGGAGDDLLYPATGVDEIDAGPGDDHVFAQDGAAEIVDCGAGVDGGNADAIDTLIDCENVAVA